jgi:hypothetical protein
VEEKGYIERYLDTIKQNLKVNVNNVTVVLELDDWEGKSSPGETRIPRFRIRLTVEQISLETCTISEDGRGWIPQFVDESKLAEERQSKKQITVQKVSVRMCDKPAEEHLDIFEHVQVPQVEEQATYGRKVLDDLNVRLRLKLRQSTEEADKKDVTMPEVVGHLEASECNLAFNKFQYATLIGVKLQELWRPDELRKLMHPTVGGGLAAQPLARPRRNHSASQWWRFAISTVMHSAVVMHRQSSGRISWTYFCDLVLFGRPYMKVWKRKLRKFDLSEADKQTVRLTEGYRAEDMLGGNKHWVPGRLCTADILYFRELAEAEKEAEDERDGSRRDMALSALKGFAPSKPKEVAVKEATQKAKSRFSGFGAKARQAAAEMAEKAQEMADKAQEFALIGVEEDVAADDFPDFVWLDKTAVGDEESRIPMSEVKVGMRYYAEDDKRVVKTAEADPPRVTRPRPPPEDLALRLSGQGRRGSGGGLPDPIAEPCPEPAPGVSVEVLPAAGGALPSIPSPKDRGPAPLTQEERLVLYRKKGILNDGDENELSSLALTPEYVRIEMLLELGKFSLSLLGPTPVAEPGAAPGRSSEPSVFAGLSIAGLSLRAQFRPDSFRLSGRILNDLSLEARPVMSVGDGTKLLALKKSAGSRGKENLVQFTFDTLTHQTEVSARLVVALAAITVQAVPAPIASLAQFFMPEDQTDDIESGSPTAGHQKREKTKRIWSKAKNMTKKLGAGKKTVANVVAATQRKSYVELNVKTKALELVVPEDGGNSGGAFHLAVAKVELDSGDHPLIHAGMFDRSCHAVKAAAEANSRAMETARAKKWCQNVTIQLSDASLSYANKPISEEMDRVCIVEPLSITAHLALAQQPGPMGPPESYLAATVLVPSINVSATANCLGRLVRLWESLAKPLLPKPKEREVVAPHPIKELPHEDLDSFVNISSRATVRVWVQIGTGAGESESATGINLRTPTINAGKAVGVVVNVPSVTIGLLKCANERTDRQPRKPSTTGISAPTLDTYIESSMESLHVSFVDASEEPVGPAVVAIAPASAGLGVRLEFASQLGWQPGAQDPYAQWPIAVSEENERVWQYGDTEFGLVNVHLGSCVGWASLDAVKILKAIRDEVTSQEDEWSAAPEQIRSPRHRLLTLSASRLALNCFLNQSDTPEVDSASHACMILSDIGLLLEMSMEPITSEREREVLVSIGGMRATLTQDGAELDLVPDVQDGQVKAKFKFGDSTPPAIEEGIPLQVGGVLQPEQSLRPVTLEVDIHAIMLWIYPSLIRLLHELLAKAPPSALDQERAKQAAKEQAMRPMKVYVNISDCDVLLSTTDPATTSLATQLVVGVHLQSLLIPPTSIGMGDDVDAQSFELTIGDEEGGLRIYTGRLGTDGITSKRTLLEDVVLELNLERVRDGYVMNMETGNICANLDGGEATALLGLATLSKLWTSGEAFPSLPGELVEEDLSSEEEDEMLDALEMGGYHAGAAQQVDTAQRPRRINIIKGSAEIPCIRLALSTEGTDVMAILVQSIQAEVSSDSIEASIFAVALSDCGASERGLCVVGMGPWADTQQEPTIEEAMEEAKDMAVENRAVQVNWLNKPVDETSNPLDGDEAGDMVDVEIAQVHVKLTPRFCKRCVDWVATVWEDREEFDDEVTVDARPPEAEEGDWVLREDHCIESTVYLGTFGGEDGSSGMKRHNRLFVERPVGVKHTTVTLSGGSLSVTVDPQGGTSAASALVYVGADVHLVLQDVKVDNFDASLFSLGPGATVSGSVNLDGTEVWDSGVSSSKLRARRRRLRRQRGARALRATIQAHELQVTSVHSFGSFTFEFALSLATTVQDHHTRFEVEGKRISLLSVGVEEKATQLFFMPQAVVMYDTSSDDGRAFVQVDLGPVPIVLSNSIGKAAFWAGNQWRDVAKSAGQLASELAKAEPKEMRKRRLEMERKRRQEAAMATLITNIQCPEIEVLMLNDTSSLENGGKQLAMKLNIQAISTDSHRIYMPDADNDEGRMHNQGKIEFSLALDVMNPSNAAWEPLCERFPFLLDANRDGPKDIVVDIQIGKKAVPITELNSIQQHGSVEISLTPTMLDVFQQTADYWVRSLSATPPIDTAQANVLATQKLTARHDEIAELCSDLQFQNDLPDLSLQYNCGPAFQTTYHDGELQVLAAGEQKMLNQRYASDSEERYLTMTIDGYSTQRFQVEQVMSEVISFKPKDMVDGTDAIVVVSVVHNVGNLKVISIRSPVFISNKSTEDITMQLIGAAGETGTLIPPGKGVSIPPTSKSMKIRPARPGMEAVYGWSAVLWRYPIDIAPQRIVTCEAMPGVGEIPYNYCVERTIEKQPGARLEGLTIDIFAPVIMVNLLPVRLQYFVYKTAVTSVTLFEGSMEHGAESVLYTVPEETYIELKCDGFKQGKRYKIPALRDMPIKVELPDGGDNILELQMQSEDTRRAGHQLTIWCPYWVINNTGLRLRYAADDTFAYNAFPGPSASDFPGEPFLVSQTKMAVSASACEGMAARNPIPPDNNCAALNPKGERDYETGWSKAFSTGTVGTAGVFSLADKAENSWRFDIGTNINLGVGKFRRTKIVSLHAQYTIVNQLTQPLLVRQSEADLSHSMSVLPGQRAPLYWPHRDRTLHLVMRIDADGHMWSAPLAFESTHNLGLPMYVRCAHEVAETPPFVIASKTVPVSSSAVDSKPVTCQLVEGQVVKMLSNDETRVEVEYIGASKSVEKGWIDSASAKGNAVLEPFDTEFVGQCFSGYLEKAGEVRTAFKKRFFVYSWPKLQYYESNGAEYKGCIDMRQVSAVQCAAKTAVLSLVTAARTYVLRAPQKDFQTWRSLLLCAVIPMKNDQVEVTADLIVDGGSQKLTVAAADPLAPAYVIQNHVDSVRVWVSQKDSSSDYEMEVGPNQSKAWVWPEPVGAERVYFRLRDTRLGKEDMEIQKDYGLDKIKEHKPLVLGDQELVFISNVRGLTKVTHIYSRRRKPGVSHARTARRNSLDLTNGAVPAEMQGQGGLETGEMKLELKIPQIGISLVGKRLMGSDWEALGLNTDILYLSVLDLELKLAQQMNGEQSMELVADWVQVDNGNRTCPFPVAFRASPTEGQHKPLFQFSVVKCAKEMGPNAFRMIQVLLQEADIVVDEELVAALMMFIGEVKFGDEDDLIGGEHHTEDFALSLSAGDRSQQIAKAETIFCEFLQIHPISFHVTYASSAGIDMGELGVSSFLSNNPLLDILANVDAAPLKLNALMLSDLGAIPAAVLSVHCFVFEFDQCLAHVLCRAVCDL